LFGIVEYVDSEIRLILISDWLSVPLFVRITWSKRSMVQTLLRVLVVLVQLIQLLVLLSVNYLAELIMLLEAVAVAMSIVGLLGGLAV